MPHLPSSYQFSETDFNPQYWKSFKGIANLYGANALAKFAQAQVIVIGIGGVGSWAVESLARSGIGSITLIDADDVCISNINRQLVALHSTKGEEKAEVALTRCIDINPLIDIYAYGCFLVQEYEHLQELLAYRPFIPNAFAPQHYITPSNQKSNTSTTSPLNCYPNTASNANVESDKHSNPTTLSPEIAQSQPILYVIDAIDNAQLKAFIINYCRQQKIKLVVCGGAGGKKDPCQVKLADLTESYQDPLLANIRNNLRRNYSYKERFKQKKFGVPVIFSSEAMTLPENAATCELNALNCNNGYGSITQVTATFANFAVSKILSMIAQKN